MGSRRSRKSKRKSIVCPPTCFHLTEAVRSKNLKCTGGDFCLVAPKSLRRPIQYRRYMKNRGEIAPRFLPASKACGELEEIDPCDLEWYQLGQQNCQDPYSGSPCLSAPQNIYIEHDGIFSRAPRNLIQSGDFNTRICYLEDISGPEFRTPLDVAIFCQRLWNQIAKIVVGFLSGIALAELCVAWWLYKEVGSRDFFKVYDAIRMPCLLLSPIFLIIILVSFCDWMDLAHMNLQHLWDTYLHRSIWMVTPLFLTAFIILLGFRSSGNNYIQLHGFHFEKHGDHKADEGFLAIVGNWEVYTMVQNFFIIIGWLLLVMTRNDDLFLLHLQCMKKYDIGRSQNYLV